MNLSRQNNTTSLITVHDHRQTTDPSHDQRNTVSANLTQQFDTIIQFSVSQSIRHKQGMPQFYTNSIFHVTKHSTRTRNLLRTITDLHAKKFPTTPLQPTCVCSLHNTLHATHLRLLLTQHVTYKDATLETTEPPESRKE